MNFLRPTKYVWMTFFGIVGFFTLLEISLDIGFFGWYVAGDRSYGVGLHRTPVYSSSGFIFELLHLYLARYPLFFLQKIGINFIKDDGHAWGQITTPGILFLLLFYFVIVYVVSALISSKFLRLS